jgi:Proteasome-substrate-size regulator, mid region
MCRAQRHPYLCYSLSCQTQRTIAVIKALGAVASAIVSRDVYYPGAKYLVPILQLLIPGIDLVRLPFLIHG